MSADFAGNAIPSRQAIASVIAMKRRERIDISGDGVPDDRSLVLYRPADCLRKAAKRPKHGCLPKRVHLELGSGRRFQGPERKGAPARSPKEKH